MPGLLEDCQEQFGSSELYAVLGISKNASDNELRKAYHKASLRVHPDRVSQKEKKEATSKFQTLGRVYKILSDAESRAIYDETGAVDEESAVSDCKDWEKYWRSLFSRVTKEDIINFEKKYVGSEEELQDLEAAYEKGKGDMDHILRSVLLCTVEDEQRFRSIIDAWIEEGRVQLYEAYSSETKAKKNKRKRKATREAEEAEAAKKELGLGDAPLDLNTLILKRSQDRAKNMDSFLDSLADKYSKPSAKGRRPKK
ncbi:DnaJ domain [Trinorchestia longiramus]|nr:DnaJ domain [Trinorchestia longiramus]